MSKLALLTKIIGNVKLLTSVNPVKLAKLIFNRTKVVDYTCKTVHYQFKIQEYGS